MTKKIPDNFCMAPWMHTYIMPSKDVFPCCSYSYIDPVATVKPGDQLTDYYNSPAYRELRQQFMNNQQPEKCTNCYRRQSAGIANDRTDLFGRYEKYYDDVISRTDPDGTFHKPKLKYIDVRDSNLCNYKCRMCSLHSSSKWLIEETEIKGGVDQNFLDSGIDLKTGVMHSGTDWSSYDLSELEEVHFAGGEPLIMPATYDVLDMIKTQKTNWNRVSIAIITNASRLKWHGHDILEETQGFDYVGFSCSIDGTQLRHDYLRSGGINDWQKVSENLDILIDWKKQRDTQGKKARLRLHSTITWANLYHWWDLYQHYCINNIMDMQVHFAFNPKGISVTCLPDSELERAIEFYQSKPDTKHIQLVISFLQEQLGKKPQSERQADLKQLKQFYTTLDKSRNQSFVDAFPEWADFYHNI